MTSLTVSKYIIASRLDAFAVLVAKVLPIADAGVFFTPGKPWCLSVYREGRSVVMLAGGWEVSVDLK